MCECVIISDSMCDYVMMWWILSDGVGGKVSFFFGPKTFHFPYCIMSCADNERATHCCQYNVLV